ncbi:hypothetical protein INR49_017298 [Caranx melampygus]|nr:hypothetical protein INR49_017298 [Caranx melampygus]
MAAKFLRLQPQLIQRLALCFQSNFDSLHFSHVLLLQEQRTDEHGKYSPLTGDDGEQRWLE